MSKQYRWSEDKHDDLFTVCMALTSYHVSSHPIKENDGDAAIKFRKRVHRVGTTTCERKQASELKYQEN